MEFSWNKSNSLGPGILLVNCDMIPFDSLFRALSTTPFTSLAILTDDETVFLIRSFSFRSDVDRLIKLSLDDLLGDSGVSKIVHYPFKDDVSHEFYLERLEGLCRESPSITHQEFINMYLIEREPPVETPFELFGTAFYERLDGFHFEPSMITCIEPTATVLKDGPSSLVVPPWFRRKLSNETLLWSQIIELTKTLKDSRYTIDVNGLKRILNECFSVVGLPVPFDSESLNDERFMLVGLPPSEIDEGEKLSLLNQLEISYTLTRERIESMPTTTPR